MEPGVSSQVSRANLSCVDANGWLQDTNVSQGVTKVDLESMHLTVGVSGNGKQICWKMRKDGKTCGAGQVP